MMGALRGGCTVKFNFRNNLRSSAHSILVIMLQSVNLSNKR